MKIALILFCLATLIIACEESDIEDTAFLSGTYTGSFVRSNPYSKVAPVKVTITFDGYRFSGASEEKKYPAICRGTYKITDQKIEFFNGCHWTAEIEWSLVLSGEYRISYRQGEIIISRDYGNGIMDGYHLKKTNAITDTKTTAPKWDSINLMPTVDVVDVHFSTFPFFQFNSSNQEVLIDM